MEPWLFNILNIAYLLITGYTLRYVVLSKVTQFLAFMLWASMVITGALYLSAGFYEAQGCDTPQCVFKHEQLLGVARGTFEAALTTLLYMRGVAANPAPHGSPTVRAVAGVCCIIFAAINSAPNFAWAYFATREIPRGVAKDNALFLLSYVVSGGVALQAVVFFLIMMAPFFSLRVFNASVLETVARHFCASILIGMFSGVAYLVPALLQNRVLLHDLTASAFLIDTLVFALLLTRGGQQAKRVAPVLDAASTLPAGGRDDFSQMFSRGAGHEQNAPSEMAGANSRRSETPFPEDHFQARVGRAEENKANLGAITEDEEEEEVGGNDKAGLTAAQQAEEGTLPLARSGV